MRIPRACGIGPDRPSRRPRRLPGSQLLILVLVSVAGWASCSTQAFAGGWPDAGSPSCGPSDACALDPTTSPSPPRAPAGESLEPGVTLLFFWGIACPHCEEAKPFIERLRHDRPELRIEAIEVRQDPVGRQRFIDTLQGIGATARGIPTFVLGEQWVTGFSPGVTEPAVERLVAEALDVPDDRQSPPPDGVQTRLFGWLSAAELGLPVFTIALGLLDGFNPCAMWVLLFLLATLAGQHDRTRMALTAGTFVVVSGVVYFGFMAAWLSVFLVLGMTRPIQLVLGAIALAMGAVNLKDFFAFGHGPSLSIPESAKPGIYARVRSVLREHSLAGSLLGIAVLAVLVNLVELLCTAGLPAIYTSILAQQQLSPLGRIAYLALYNLAYVADDSVMVTVAVVTLSRRRLAERAGRWLKLASGAVMLTLGFLLVFHPEWLP